MHSPDALRPARVPDPPPLIMRAELPSPALSRFLYTAVGGDWHWTDRLPWTPERWMQYLARDEVETWIAYVRGNPAGYVELEAQPEGNVEIAYFGLLPQFIGRGIGGHLLTIGTRRAWDRGARRVWVHTCSLDGPTARANYEARGFRLFKTEITSSSGAADPA
jgi:ribosomal protein S18 acetylase RimI-like enzyme